MATFLSLLPFLIPLSSYLGSFKRKVLLFEAGFAYQRQRDILLIQACNPIRGEGGRGWGWWIIILRGVTQL